MNWGAMGGAVQERENTHIKNRTVMLISGLLFKFPICKHITCLDIQIRLFSAFLVRDMAVFSFLNSLCSSDSKPLCQYDNSFLHSAHACMHI